MSGTSADGVSAALTRIGPGRTLAVLASGELPFRPVETDRLRALQRASARELSAANGWLGEKFALAAVRLMKKTGAKPAVIGSHGQTVWHEPGRHTLQLGEPSIIAERTGVTTVADFRPRDVAAGGQGAPLLPFFDDWLFGRSNRPRATLNIGGIANVCLVGGRHHGSPGFDTGPGNGLIDRATRRLTGAPFDRGGAIARRGRIDERLLTRLLAHPYFRRRPPKSTGPETFGDDFLRDRVGAKITADVIATLTVFTARTIAAALHRWLPAVDEVILSGGGAFNRTLVEHLEWLLFPAVVRPVSVYAIHPLAKEPAAFALFAALAIRGEVNTLPRATGAARAVVAGKIVPGRAFRGLR
jgi:anhydro-N-acetylmuramic acid kinase